MIDAPDDWLKNGLPVYSGGKDRTTARRLIERLGGPQGIKTAYTTNGDGSVTSVKLRGDCAPEVTTTTSVVEKPQIKPYVEIDTALRTYHVDHKNYHVGSNKDKALRPFLMKYIKKVVFHGLTVEFTLPDSADPNTYDSERTITPKTPGFSFPSFYPRRMTGENPVLLLNGSYVEKAKRVDGTPGRTFFPKAITRSCDGLIITEYTPIKTLTVKLGDAEDSGELTLYFLNPTDLSFKW